MPVCNWVGEMVFIMVPETTSDLLHQRHFALQRGCVFSLVKDVHFILLFVGHTQQCSRLGPGSAHGTILVIRDQA